jgi:hypothetical protein
LEPSEALPKGIMGALPVNLFEFTSGATTTGAVVASAVSDTTPSRKPVATPKTLKEKLPKRSERAVSPLPSSTILVSG